MNKAEKKFTELIELIKRLRAPDGCPWDKKQTPQSFKPYLLEEAHELAEAIDGNNPEHIKEELGDLFFQAAFVGQLYEEKNFFSMEQALQEIIDKMIRRHPHVFENKKITSPEQIRQNWLKIKAAEKNKKTTTNEELDFPTSLPALTRAHRVTERAERNGCLVIDNRQILLAKIQKAEKEISESTGTDADSIAPILGDMLFTLVHLGHIAGVDCEDALRLSTERYVTAYKLLCAGEHEGQKD